MSGVSSVTKKRQEGSVPAGTVTHIAPERYEEHPYGEEDDGGRKMDLVKKSDVYSYGVLLWEIRERQHPYQGQFRLLHFKTLTIYFLGKISNLIRVLVQGRKTFPEGKATGVPPFFDDLMEQCLQYNPQNRPTFREIVVKLMAEEEYKAHLN